ncbi:hypothetical protein L873DRAFT_1726279, partial [Choiromyces venosus 120613-1]
LECISDFNYFSSVRQTGPYYQPLLDGHGSHDTRKFLSFCDEKKIIPFCLLQHTIHLLQTLEIVVFKPPKHYYAEDLDYAITYIQAAQIFIKSNS